jgi:hypothetical protein
VVRVRGRRAAPRARSPGAVSARFSHILRLVRRLRLPRRAWRVFLAAPAFVQAAVVIALAVLVWFALNGIYQVVRKPSELFFPVSGTLNKTPAETWREYGPLFRSYSTEVMTPPLLAALAQVEGSGNPVARTYWRWSFTPAPFDVYRPASSAVGMYQLTDGTFAIARHYCIHDHQVVEEGPWNDFHSCWFNSLYMRVIPGNAIEMTSAYLDRAVNATLVLHRVRHASLQQKQDLASVIHLCGAGAGDLYARRGLRLTAGQKCGDHTASVYVGRVNSFKRLFTRLAAGG